MLWNTIGTLFLAIYVLTAHTGELALPPNDGFITDPGDSIPLVEEEELEQKMLAEKRQTGLEFVSVILPSLDGRDIAHLAWELRTKWGLKQNGSGILLLIVREEGKVLIAPGEGSEQILTDTVLQGIIETDILPFLRRREYAVAIEQGTSAVRNHLRQGNIEEPTQSGLSAKGASYPIVLFLFVLLGCCTWARTRRSHTGRTRRRSR